MQSLHPTLAASLRLRFWLSNTFIAMPPNPALNRTGRHMPSIWRVSARPAGYLVSLGGTDVSFDLAIFDCDGVLVDTEPIANRVLVDVLADLGLPMEPDECSRTFIGRSAPACCDIIQQRLARPLPSDFLREWEARLHAAFRAEVTAIPG